MSLLAKATRMAEAVKATKESHVAANPDNPDLQIQLYFWRGDDLIAVVSCPLDRDIGLHAGQVGVVGFSATTMAMVFESYHTHLKDSPITGEPWMHQEMQFVCESMPEAQEKGWVTPALTLSAHERGGDYFLRLMPYRLKEDRVEWDEVADTYLSSDEEVQADGSMFHYLQHSMQAPTIADHIKESAEMGQLVEYLGDEQGAIHSDMACVRAMKDKHLINSVIFPVIEGSARAEQIAERLGPDAIKFVPSLSMKEE